MLSLATVKLIHPSTWRGDICSSADHLSLFFNPSLWQQFCVSCLCIRQVRLSPLNPDSPIASGFKTAKRDVFGFCFFFFPSFSFLSSQ